MSDYMINLEYVSFERTAAGLDNIALGRDGVEFIQARDFGVRFRLDDDYYIVPWSNVRFARREKNID